VRLFATTCTPHSCRKHDLVNFRVKLLEIRSLHAVCVQLQCSRWPTQASHVLCFARDAGPLQHQERRVTLMRTLHRTEPRTNGRKRKPRVVRSHLVRLLPFTRALAASDPGALPATPAKHPSSEKTRCRLLRARKCFLELHWPCLDQIETLIRTHRDIPKGRTDPSLKTDRPILSEHIVATSPACCVSPTDGCKFVRIVRSRHNEKKTAREHSHSFCLSRARYMCACTRSTWSRSAVAGNLKTCSP